MMLANTTKTMSLIVGARCASSAAAARGLAAAAPGLITLHARLNLPQEVPLETLAVALDARGLSGASDHSASTATGLSLFGASLLSHHVTSHLVLTYPRLPSPVLRAAVRAYTGDAALANVAREWGVEPDTKTEMEKFLIDEPAEFALGRLRYNMPAATEPGVTLVDNTATAAFASVPRTIAATVHAHAGAAAAKDFISRHLLSRHLDISSMFQFASPARELSVLCAREGLEPPAARLLAETGRLTVSPVFVVGIFSAGSKLGEGQGNSLVEAKTRAAVNALKGWYLYRPLASADSSHVAQAASTDVVI